MIDLRIENVEKVKDKSKIFNNNTVITEKFDGTKLNLIFTGGNDKYPFILAYKGFRIYPFEFDKISLHRVPNNPVFCHSIGPSQYAIIFDYLYPKFVELRRKMKPGTQLFFEFVQRKKTLTRDYIKYHDLYLIGVGQCEWWEENGRVYTIEKEQTFNYRSVEEYANKWGFLIPTLLKKGTEGTFEDNLKYIENNLMDQSSLGGIPEGVVIHTDGDLYKVINPGQYDKSIRQKIKQRYDSDPETENRYWKEIYKLSQTFIEVTGIDRSFGYEKSLKTVSDLCYGCDCPVPHPKRSGIQKQDDLFLTCKNLLINEFNCDFRKLIGIYPIAGKPVHAGHWKMIQQASQNNDHLIIFVSEKDRKINRNTTLSGVIMKRVWKEFLIPNLPENCTVIFCDNPTTETMHYISFYNMYDNSLSKGFSIYSDTQDASRWNKMTNIRNIGIDRKMTVNISGTQMRKFLIDGKKYEFMKFLPEISGQKEKRKIWDTLQNSLGN